MTLNAIVSGFTASILVLIFLVTFCPAAALAEEQKKEEFDDNELRERLDRIKLQEFFSFCKRFHSEPEQGARDLGQGAFLFDYPELLVSVAALNSCERESHREEDHLGHLEKAQAQALMERAFQKADSRWRGLGPIPLSGLQPAEDFTGFDPRGCFDPEVPETPEPPGASQEEAVPSP